MLGQPTVVKSLVVQWRKGAFLLHTEFDTVLEAHLNDFLQIVRQRSRLFSPCDSRAWVSFVCRHIVDTFGPSPLDLIIRLLYLSQLNWEMCLHMAGLKTPTILRIPTWNHNSKIYSPLPLFWYHRFYDLNYPKCFITTTCCSLWNRFQMASN